VLLHLVDMCDIANVSEVFFFASIVIVEVCKVGMYIFLGALRGPGMYWPSSIPGLLSLLDQTRYQSIYPSHLSLAF
jgi:hypothetical protein